jgi:hypothetical protein
MTRSRFPGQFFAYTLGDQVDRVRIYLELLETQVFRWGYILGWIGAWEQLKSNLTAFVFLALAALGIYVFGMNYGGITFRIYLIPSYLIFAVFLGCGLSAVRKWLAGLLYSSPRQRPKLAQALTTCLAALILIMPFYPIWTNWVEVDQSKNTYYRDLAKDFVDKAGPEFILVESETHYDELEAILYTAWADRGWYSAQTVTPGGIDPWLGQRPIYAWFGDLDINSRYIQESAPGLLGMARIVGVRDD